MKALLYLASVFATVLTANAQSDLEAMVNYAATGPYDGPLVYSAIHSEINGPIGWTFQTTSDIDVTALGAFNYLIPSRGNLEVGLWNSSGTLLASQSVTSASLLVDQSRYESVAPLLLTAGQTYYLAAFAPGGPLSAVVVTPGAAPNGNATMSSEIQLGLVAYSANSGFTFPGTTDGNPGDAIIAPNFEFQPVPEPSAAVLLGGTTGLLFLSRRGRRAG
jgi:hypothetical protein